MGTKRKDKVKRR